MPPVDAFSRVAAGKWGEALELTVAEWAREPRPEVADAAWRLAERVARDFAAPRARTKVEFQSAWLTVAEQDRSVEATAWLARTLGEKLIFETNVGHLRTRALLERFRELRRRAPSPLVHRAAWMIIETAPFSGNDVEVTELMYRPFLALVRDSNDASLVPRIAALVQKPRAERGTVRDMLAMQLPELQAVLGTVSAPPRDARWDVVLPEQVVTAPPLPATGDDAERLVLSDELLERGDPRGEFIALQLRAEAGDLDAVGQRRMASLLRAHRASWLGALAPVATYTEFRRGALYRMALARNAVTSSPRWMEAAQSPALRTLEVLDKHRGNFEHFLSFVNSPMTVNLRRIEVINAKLLEHIRAERRAQLTEFVFAAEPTPAAVRQFVHFPALKRLCFVGNAKRVEAMLGGRPLELITEAARLPFAE